MSRVFLCVMDSVGLGGAPDAADFGDEGANTLGRIMSAAAPALPFMMGLGLGQAMARSTGFALPFGATGQAPRGLHGVARERSEGKDTPSGHWELAGVAVPWAWHVFPNETPAFPPDILAAVARAAGSEGSLANCHSGGIAAIERFGAAHLRTGWPICYTSVDSVFQIAAHEEAFGLARLYQLCADMAAILHPLKVGRVIARPFTGAPGAFRRTPNRKDFAMEVPGETILDRACAAGREVHAIGKISDIFSGRGITHVHKGADDMALFDALLSCARAAPEGALIFANFVEFDTLYGHMRDVAGYARALERFDARLPELEARLRPDDLVLLTADHGNDPGWPGSDHTREQVPVLGFGPKITGDDLGVIRFEDVGALVLRHLRLS